MADENKGEASLSGESELSEEAIDQILKEKDPEFFKKLEEINSAKLDLKEIDETSSQPEVVRHQSRLQAFKSAALVRFEKLVAQIKSRLFRLFYYLKGPFKEKLIQSLKTFVSYLKTKIHLAAATFQGWSARKKVAFVGLILGGLGTVYLIHFTSQGGFFKKTPPLFAASMADFTEQIFTWDPAAETMKFYAHPNIAPQIHLMKKMAVNLKRHELSQGRNPMGVFEFYIEGLSAEALIEIKENESYFRDKMMRSTEEFTVEELQTPEGRELLLTRLRDSLNSDLSQGLVKRVFFKNIILNPY